MADFKGEKKGYWESDMLDKIGPAINAIGKGILPTIKKVYVEVENSKLYNDMRDGKVPDTTIKINTDVNDMKAGNIAGTGSINLNDVNDANMNANVVGNSQDKVRVLTRENTPNVVNNSNNNTSNTNLNNNNNIYSQYSNEPSENPFDSLKNTGNVNSSTILIVLAAFVIVAMLVVICLTLLGSFGVNI